jgi:cobalt/nickel transport protein
MRTRTFAVAALVVTLLLAGVASYYASSHPDGLEHVAEKTGFLDTADDHPAGDGPMADYSVKGVDSPRLAGGLAGVVGVVVTLVLAGVLGYAVRRRRPRTGADPDRHEERV